MAPLSPHRLPLNKQIKITANGIRYEGYLVGVDEEEIFLKSKTRTWSLLLKDIQSLCEVNDPHHQLQESAWSNEFDFNEDD